MNNKLPKPYRQILKQLRQEDEETVFIADADVEKTLELGPRYCNNCEFDVSVSSDDEHIWCDICGNGLGYIDPDKDLGAVLYEMEPFPFTGRLGVGTNGRRF